MFFLLFVAIIIEAFWIRHLTRKEAAALAAGRGTGTEGYEAMAYFMVFAVADFVWFIVALFLRFFHIV